jgi:ribosomal protein S18 acetylase RimI-like enzyme
LPPSSPEAGFESFASARLARTGFVLRHASDRDRVLIAGIYACTREEELRLAPWSPEQKRTFTDWQSQQQEAHYALHYPACERLVVERDAPIGRLYVNTAAEVRLMEVTLLPQWRNQGIGTTLTRLVLEYADFLRLPASLHVEPFNPAKRMYERLGFAVVETRGIYEFMVRPAAR